MSKEVLTARSRLGVAARRQKPGEVAAARRDLAAAKIESYVAKTVAGAPPLTKEQLDRIAVLLRPAGGAAE